MLEDACLPRSVITGSVITGTDVCCYLMLPSHEQKEKRSASWAELLPLHDKEQLRYAV